jgi:hypothetical protein
MPIYGWFTEALTRGISKKQRRCWTGSANRAICRGSVRATQSCQLTVSNPGTRENSRRLRVTRTLP